MYKLYSYINDKIKILTEKTDILSQFELVEVVDRSVEDLLAQKYDVIEFDMAEYEKFIPHIGVVDWKTNMAAVADCLILKGNRYKSYNILPEAILRILKKNVVRINSQRSVIVIGDIYFLTGIVIMLALSGFTEIIVSLTDTVAAEEGVMKKFEKKIKSFVFDLNLKIISIHELTSSEQDAFLLISNFKKEKNKEAYELLSYFNFLSEGAFFIDCNSIKDGYLVEDARKADIFVVDELEVLESKYIKLLELLKNSP